MMNKHEVGELLAMCSALDGQQVTEPKALMWLQVLEGASYEECRDAIVPAYKEATNGIVTAKGLWDVVRRVRSQPKAGGWLGELDEGGWRADPQPVCEEHGLRILSCDDCCSLIFHQAGHMRDHDRHSWAMSHVYKAKEAWA
jgi:hypothetical protein